MNLFEKQTQLTQLFAQNPVNAAYLTGSLSNRASFGQLSDVDIAILLMDQIKADQFLDYQLYFFSELAKRLESESIDVVILNKASLLLKSQVIKNGQILFSRDERQRILFETRAVMAYLDFKRFDEMQNQALSRRLRGPARQPVDPELIRPPLAKLKEAIHILRDLQAEPRETFLNDHRLYGLAERYLQQAIENYLYICSVFVATMGLPKPDDFHNLLSSIAAQQVIPRTLAFRLELLTNLREELLRTTTPQTRELVYEHLQYRLETLEEFSTAIEANL